MNEPLDVALAYRQGVSRFRDREQQPVVSLVRYSAGI